MANSKKYSYQIEKVDTLWTGQILRKASSKLFIVSKEQEGFSTEAEAKEWAETEAVRRFNEFKATLPANTGGSQHTADLLRESLDEVSLDKLKEYHHFWKKVVQLHPKNHVAWSIVK